MPDPVVVDPALLSKLGRCDAKLQRQIGTFRQLLQACEQSGSVPVAWTVKITNAQTLIDQTYQTLDEIPYPTPASLEEISQTINSSINDLDAATMDLQNRINILDANRVADYTISSLIRLKNSLPAQVDNTDAKGFFERKRNNHYAEWSAQMFIASDEKRTSVADAFDAVDAAIHKVGVATPPPTPASQTSESSVSPRNDSGPARRSGFANLNWKVVPSWNGSSADYQSWKHRLQLILNQNDLTDSEKSNVLTLDIVVKKLLILINFPNIFSEFNDTIPNRFRHVSTTLHI